MAGKNVNPIQSYQEATNQLLAINAQRRSNLAEAKAEELSEAARNNTLSQAAEFVSSQGPQGTTQATNATFNPATQNILKQYGLGQPKIQKSSSSSQQVTKQNIVINNKNTNITNNNIQVPSNTGGPIQGRPVQFQDPSQIKFKSWVQNAFAQQNEIAEKRKREYEKRDSALVRNSNRLMKKLEETGKSVASSMNPKNMASSMGNQLKTLLYLFGFAFIAKNWPTILDKVTDIGKNVIEIKDKVVNFFTSEGGGLTKLLGGKDNEKPFEALKNLFLDKNDGILAIVRKWLSDKISERSAALKNIEKPDLNVLDPSESLNKIIKYLGDILGAIMDPSSVMGATVSSKSKEQEFNNSEKEKLGLGINARGSKYTTIKDSNGNKINVHKGDAAFVEGDIKGLAVDALDENGNLRSNYRSTYSQGLVIENSVKEATKGNINISSIATGFSRLSDIAKKEGIVRVGEDFLDNLGLSNEEKVKLLSEGKARKREYVYVARPITEEEFSLYSENKNTANSKRSVNSVIAAPHNVNKEDYTIELRVKDDDGNIDYNPKRGEQIIDRKSGIFGKKKTTSLYEITEEGIRDIVRMFSKDFQEENTDIDINNKKFLEQLEKGLKSKAKGKIKHTDINIENLSSIKSLMEQHNQEEAQMWENSRASAATSNISQKVHEVGDKAKSWVANTGVANFTIHSNPSNIDSGDISGVIEASKKGVFYSNSSDSKNNGSGEGPMSKNGGGYIPLGKDLKGFMHKCTSGPATFYYDGTGGKVNLNGLWWDTKSPKTAEGTRIGEAGFQHVWSGTREQGYNTASIEKTGFELKPGDIMLNFGYGKNGPSSHAQMWNGEQWVSDTYQGDRSFVYRSGRLGDKSAQIWRYDKMINTDQYANAQKADSETEQTGLLAAEDFEEENVVIPEFSNPVTPDFNQETATTEPEQTPKYTLPTYTYTPNAQYTLATNGTNRNYSESIPEKTTDFTSDKNKSNVTDYTVPLNNMSSDLSTLNQISGVNAEQLEGIRNTIAALSSQISSIGSKQSTPNTPWAVPFTQPNTNT